MFKVGDRVRCIHGYSGVRKWELGVVQRITGGGSGFCDISVKWDEFNSYRHNNDGLCERGHGWMVSASDLELVYEVIDLGNLPAPDDVSELFA